MTDETKALIVKLRKNMALMYPEARHSILDELLDGYAIVRQKAIPTDEWMTLIVTTDD